MKYYVDASVSKSGNGSQEYPFKNIQEAANIAKAGDEVLVYPGIYREYVNPIQNHLHFCGAFKGGDYRSRGSKMLGAIPGKCMDCPDSQRSFRKL